MENTNYKIGVLSATVDGLKADVTEIKADQKQQIVLLTRISERLAEQRGARKVLISIAGGGGLLGALASWAFERLFSGPHS